MKDDMLKIDEIIKEYNEIYSNYNQISLKIVEIKESLIDLENERLQLKNKLDETRTKEREFMDNLRINKPEEFNNIKKLIENKIKKMIS